MCSPYLWLPCNPGEGITLRSLPFSRSYSPSALGGALFCWLGGARESGCRHVQGSGEPESATHHLPWLTWEGRRSSGTSRGTRMAARGGGQGLGGPVLLPCTGLGAWDVGQGLCGRSRQEMAAPTQKGSGSRSCRPHRDRPTGEGSVPAGHGRQRRGERERVPAQTLWLVREQTCQSSGSLIKTA